MQRAPDETERLKSRRRSDGCSVHPSLRRRDILHDIVSGKMHDACTPGGIDRKIKTEKLDPLFFCLHFSVC